MNHREIIPSGYGRCVPEWFEAGLGSFSRGPWFWIAIVSVLMGTGCASKPVADKPKSREEAERVAKQAAFLQASGDSAGARVWWERAARHYSLLNDSAGLAVAWHNLGMVRRSIGDHEAASADLERAAVLNARLGLTEAWWRNQIGLLQVENDSGSSNVWNRIASLEHAAGRPAAGRLAALYTHERARARLARGQWPEAKAEIDLAIVEYRRDGDRSGAAAAGALRARLAGRVNRLDDAIAAWKEVLGEYEALGDVQGIAVALAGLGVSLGDAGKNLSEAIDLLRRSESNLRTLRREEAAEEVRRERERLETAHVK